MNSPLCGCDVISSIVERIVSPNELQIREAFDPEYGGKLVEIHLAQPQRGEND